MADSQTRYLQPVTLLLLLAFVHAVLSAASDTDVPFKCNREPNKQVSFRYIIPKRFAGKSIKLNVYYKMEKETAWKLLKTYSEMVTAEIADQMEAPLQPTTPYQLRVISEQSSLNDSDINVCEFCSEIAKLDSVKNLTVHSVGPTWFAFRWRMPSQKCPKIDNYWIRLHFGSSTKHMRVEGNDNILTLNTGEKYLMIKYGVLPNTTYNVSIELSVLEFGTEFKSPSVTTTLTTLLNPIPKLDKPPRIIGATDSSLKLSLYPEPQCKDLCLIIWQYKELEETAWHFLERKPLSEEMEITGLNASTVYEVRAFPQHDCESEPHESVRVPLVWAATLPVLEPINPEYPPQVVKASNTSLTMITGFQKSITKGYIAHWEYKKTRHNSMWQLAGKEFANREMTIKNLDPDTTYEVRYNLHWPTSNNFSSYSPSEEVKTCPNSVPHIRYIWARKRLTNSMMMQWSVNVTCRVQFLIRWKPYDFTDETVEYPPDSYDTNKCPYNATLLNCTKTNNCNDSITDLYSFTATENIIPATRYFFEVTAVDWEGKCSESETAETATPLEYWGGIRIGLWILIIFSMLLLFASVPVCILLKKRVVARMSTGRDVTFNASSNGTGLNGEDTEDADAVVFHEPTTRILDRRSEPPDM